jgi:hypothetical protein
MIIAVLDGVSATANDSNLEINFYCENCGGE